MSEESQDAYFVMCMQRSGKLCDSLEVVSLLDEISGAITDINASLRDARLKAAKLEDSNLSALLRIEYLRLKDLTLTNYQIKEYVKEDISND